MSRLGRLIGFSFLLAALSFATAAQAGAFSADSALSAPSGGRYVVLYEPSVKASRVDDATGRLEKSLDFAAGHLYSHAVRGFSATLSAGDVAALRDDPRVAIVSRDRRVHALASATPVLPGEIVPTGVQRIGASNGSLVRGASGVGVAVIDSGIDLTHPDLNAVAGTNCITPGAPPIDDNGHGTHVAGTIGARNNGAGVVGVAPDTKVYAVKVLDATGSGFDSQVICGIDWVTANAAALNIKVANMSLGGRDVPSTCANNALHAAVCNSSAAGVTYAVAAGNDGIDFGGSMPDSPASYPEVLTTTAMVDTDGQPGGLGPACGSLPPRPDDQAADFSDFATKPGDIAHTIAAPGGCIRSTFPGGGYAIGSGTSMASPHVAGAIALCINDSGVNGPCAGMSPAQIIAKLRADAAAHATATNGFLGDPQHTSAGRYYGNLLWVGLPPSATTGAASDLRPTAALLNGSVAPNGQATTYKFELGKTTAYGQTVGAGDAGAGNSAQPVAAPISGLQPATTYHFRLVATNATDASIGADRTFRTANPPPGFYASFVACKLAKSASPSHVCNRGDNVGAFFQAQAPTTYTVCVRYPNGGTACRNRSVPPGVLQVTAVNVGGRGAYKATWSVDGANRGGWGFRIRRSG